MNAADTYDVTKLNRVGRMPDRGHYDHESARCRSSLSFRADSPALVAIHAIIRAAPCVHVSFVDSNGMPQCVPMVAALDESEDGLFLFLHGALLSLYLLSVRVLTITMGYGGSRFVRMNEEKGTPLCVTATFVDGIVLGALVLPLFSFIEPTFTAIAAFHHSINYRSATLHGFTDPIDSNDLTAKQRASQLVVDAVGAHMSRAPV